MKKMNKFVIVKLETHMFAKTYDDIKEDKYLATFVLNGTPYPIKCWTSHLESAIWFGHREDALKICDLLGVNTPYPLRIEEIDNMNML